MTSNHNSPLHTPTHRIVHAQNGKCHVAELFVSALSFAGKAASFYVLHHAPCGCRLFISRRRRCIYPPPTMNVARQMEKVSQCQSSCSHMVDYTSILFPSRRQLSNCVNDFLEWLTLNTERAEPVKVNAKQSHMWCRSGNTKIGFSENKNFARW